MEKGYTSVDRVVFPIAGAFAVIAFLHIAFGLRAVAEIFGEDAPAWVQAIGSIAAVFFAIRVANNQHEQNLRRDRETNLAAVARAVAGPLAMAEEIASQLEALRKMLHNRNWQGTLFGANLKDEPDRMLNEYRALPLYALPTYELIKDAVDVGNKIRVVTLLLNQSFDEQTGGPTLLSNNHGQHSLQAIVDLDTEIGRFRTEVAKVTAGQSDHPGA
ncbi:MAG: hypothetical protein WKG52_00990 [Variovorax sp.]